MRGRSEIDIRQRAIVDSKRDCFSRFLATKLTAIRIAPDDSFDDSVMRSDLRNELDHNRDEAELTAERITRTKEAKLLFPDERVVRRGFVKRWLARLCGWLVPWRV